MTPEPRVTLPCRDCGEPVERSRNCAAQLRRDGQGPQCQDCRFPDRVPHVQVRPRHLAWWRERLSADELRELGGALER